MSRFLKIALLGATITACSQQAAQDSVPQLIRGTPVTSGWGEVVRIQTGNSGCTATIVGERVIVTAAHCADTGATSSFTVAGRTYDAYITRSPVYPGEDHDIAIGVTLQVITGITPASIGGTAAVGVELTILGYGCTQPGGTGGNDGVLRMGKATVSGFTAGYDMISGNGAALCYGDSGGPAFVLDGAGRHLLLGINSKGNISDTNYNTRTDLQKSRDFFNAQAAQNGVTICGINRDCGTGPLPTPTPTPTATPTATPTPSPSPTPSPGATTKTYSYKNIGMYIPDTQRWVGFEVPVDISGTVTDLTLDVAISHTWAGDLHLELEAPDGTLTVLRDRRGGSGSLRDRYGLGAAYAGTSAKGRWILWVIDLEAYDYGYLQEVGFTITVRR